jgi:hypothetical protein
MEQRQKFTKFNKLSSLLLEPGSYLPYSKNPSIGFVLRSKKEDFLVPLVQQQESFHIFNIQFSKKSIQIKIIQINLI